MLFRSGGFLHEHHRCRGLWRRGAREAAFGLAGVSAGAAFAFLMADRPAVELIVTCALLGGVLVTAFRKFAQF